MIVGGAHGNIGVGNRHHTLAAESVMERRNPVEPISHATESNVCTRGWLRIVAATARSAGLILLIAGFISPVTGTSPAYAGEDGLTWVVTQASGDVLYRMGDEAPTEWRALHVGAVLGAAVEVRTGSDSRVLLTHQGTTLAVSPESGVKLPGSERPNGVYRVFQSLGTLLYRIKERAAGMATFEVETPYLAVVVKGTVFTVKAFAEEAFVELSEGVVRVQPTHGGTGITLVAGQTARVTRASGTDVIIKGPSVDLGKGNPGNPGGDGPRGGGTGGGSANTGNPGGGTGEGGNPGGGHVARSDLSQDTAGGWMAVIWAAVTDSMNTWVGAVWLLVMWAVVWVTVSTLRISFTRTKKRPSRSAAAMARGRIRQPV